MAYKTMLTHVIADRGCQARLRMAASVASVWGGEVIGLGAQAPWPFEDAASGRGPEFERLVRFALEGVSMSERAFRQGAPAFASPPAWRSDVAQPNAALCKNASGADLILAYRTTGAADPAVYASPDALVMEAGLPVLLLPGREVPFKGEAALLAWKNTRESRRAISVALPALREAKRVVIASVCQAREIDVVERELRDVSERLSRHGVKATTLVEVGAPGSAGRRLAGIGHAEDCDFIVAGGYGHSRLREWVLGGVTRDLIAETRSYVLLSH